MLEKKDLLRRREANFELLRIVCILMVITLHFLTNSNLKDYVNFYSANGAIYIFLKAFCYMADNLFVILSGYFLSMSVFKIRKIVDLWVQVFFYSAIIYFILALFGLAEFSMKTMYFSLFPVYSKQYWFFSCYLMLYLVFPLINKIIATLEKTKYSTVLFIGFIMFSVLESISIISKDPFLLGSGKSLTWFIYLYLVGAYIRLHGFEVVKKKRWLAIISLSMIIMTTLSYFVLDILITQVGISHIEADKLIKLNSITVYPASVLMFLIFKKIELNKEWLINLLVFLSPLTFGVYLIHDHNNLRVVLWNLICPEQYASSWFIWCYLIMVVPVIYASCALLEYIRKKLFSILKINQLGIQIEKYIKIMILRENE